MKKVTLKGHFCFFAEATLVDIDSFYTGRY